MLVATSCLFATVVVHAFHAQAWAYHHIFLAVLVLSVMAHGIGDARVMAVDKAVAHMAFMFTVSEGMCLKEGDWWMWVFPCAVLGLWGVQSLYPHRARQFHVGLHCVSVVGLHLFMAVLYPMEPWLVWFE